MILIAKQKWRHRHRKETYGHQSREGGRDELGDWDGRLYTIDTVCKIDNKSLQYSTGDSTQRSAVQCSVTLVLSDSLSPHGL